jgi:hypothetical protein
MAEVKWKSKRERCGGIEKLGAVESWGSGKGISKSE